jgi:hypothetical protein
MRFQRYVYAAAAVSLAVAAPLFAQDTTATASGSVADSGRPLPRHRPTAAFDSATLRRLPIDDVRQVPVLVHGVYGLTDPRAFSVRGGLNGDAAIYVDGALIRNGQRLDAELLPPVRGVQSMTVTTGLAPVYFSGVQAGLLQIETPIGGEKWSGGVRYRADEAGLDLWGNVGFHRIEATAGGALPLGLTGFAAFVLDGQQSLETEKLRDVQAPVYIASGTDTVIRQPVDFGNPNSDTIDLAIPRFIQYSGQCDESSNGTQCHGLQVPFSTRGAHVFQAKIQKAYGSDQHVNLTVLAGRQQARDFPFTQLYNPTNRTAARTSSRAFILDWLHRLPGPRLALNVNVSYQSDERASGVLTPESEAESFSPSGGFLWSPLRFVADLNTTHDVTIAGTMHDGVGYLDDIQINCLLAGQAACTDLVPFLDRNDLLSAQPYRMNPYATEQSLRLPFYTSGLDGPFDLSREHRWQGRLSLAWRSAASNTMFAGVEFAQFETRRYAASSMISAFAIDAYAEQPRQTGAYFVDQAQFGDFELTAGIRIDRFDSRALYPIVPGRISSITDPFVVILPADTVPLAPFDPLNPTANFRPAEAHSVVSPQLQLRFDAWPGGTVRFTVGRQSRPPSFENLFAHKNTDLSQANFSTSFGRDIAPVQAEIFELSARAELGDDHNTFADVALYSHDLTSEQVILEGFKDPGSGNVLSPFRVFTTASRGKVKGIDATVGRHFSNVVTASVTVSHQSGAFPDGARTFGTGSVAVRWGNQAPLGAVLANTDISSILRLASNRKYTPQQNAGSGATIDQGGTFPTGPENVDQLPMFKTLDIRITRTFPLGRLGGAVFVESTNLLNWTNFTDIFTETGEATNPSYRARWVDEQVAQLETEAQSEGLLIVAGGESAVDLRSPGVCQGWGARASNGAGGPADCVLLQRAEQRFGNSDGLFSRSEYSASFGAWYDLENAPYRFYGPGRRIRLGVELSF